MQQTPIMDAPFKVRRIVFQRKQFGVYLYRKEIVDDSEYGGDGELPMVNCYDLQTGVWIGDAKTARRLVRQYGIREFHKRTSASHVASVGYAPIAQKWYGWSHRAIFGYKTRKAAENFAASVA